MTLKSQQRNVLEFLTITLAAARENKSAPSLLPEVVSDSDEQELMSAA